MPMTIDAPSQLASSVAAIAEDQFNRYRQYHETHPPLRNQIKRYWTETGFDFPDVGTPWSAVFVSWCFWKAGAAKADFPFNPQHSQFIKKFIANADAGKGALRAYPITAQPVTVGDIIQNNRNGGTIDYNEARTNGSYPSHTAIVVKVGTDADGNYALTIGGNEGDTVGRRVVRLDAKGRVRQIGKYYICVVDNGL